MKIVGWMHSKLNGKQGSKKPGQVSANHHMPQATSKEEFSDWPQALLAIGTFGISNLTEDPKRGSEASCQNNPRNVALEEERELQKKLNLLLDTPKSGAGEESETQDPPVCEDSSDKYILKRSTSAVFSRGEDIFLENTSSVIRKKSLTFLLKKIFSSRSRFGCGSLVRDSLPDPTTALEKSRIEKILRAMLNKKIHPQGSTPKPRKYLQRNASMNDSEDEMLEDDKDGSKWVKTDSEYIILEI